MGQLKFGWVRQQPDPRDKVFRVGRRITASLPPAMSLKANMPTQVLNQADEGACGPHSASELIMFDQKVEYIPVDVPARNVIYWFTRFLMGSTGSDSGVDNRTMLKALARYGFCSEKLFPYSSSTMYQQPSQVVASACLPNRISDYASVAVNPQQAKGCIVSGRPFIFGFDVFQGIMSEQCMMTGVVPVPRPGETPIGGHDILAYAYSDQDQMLRCRNHWLRDDGTPYGDGGDLLIPYAYAFDVNHVSDWWTINTIPGAMQPPTPVPPAPPTPLPIPTPPPPSPVPPTPTPVPDIWQSLVFEIQKLLKLYGPFAVPFIEAWVSKLPLPAVVIAAIDALLEQYLGKNHPVIHYLRAA